MDYDDILGESDVYKTLGVIKAARAGNAEARAALIRAWVEDVELTGKSLSVLLSAYIIEQLLPEV